MKMSDCPVSVRHHTGDIASRGKEVSSGSLSKTKIAVAEKQHNQKVKRSMYLNWNIPVVFHGLNSK